MGKLKYLSYAILIALSSGFVSCSDDEDEGNGSNGVNAPSALIGMWEDAPGGEYKTTRDGNIIEQGELDNPLDGCRWQFDTSGKIHVYDYVIVDADYNKDWIEVHSFDYTYSDNKIHIAIQQNEWAEIHEESTTTFSVIDLQETQMILDNYIDYNEDGHQYNEYQKWVLKKVAQ